MKRAIYPLGFFVLAALAGCGAATDRPSLCVRIENGAFVLNDGHHARPFTPWGFNYDRTVVDGRDLLLEDVMRDAPEVVDEDFAAMRRLGGNTVRVFIATSEVLADVNRINEAGLLRLDHLLNLADKHDLRLILTGLATLRPTTIPAWMQAASDAQMEQAELLYWRTVAGWCRGRAAIFAFDLQNEPVVHWTDAEAWVEGCFDMSDGQRFCYVHRRYRQIRSRWTAHIHATYETEDALHAHWPDYPRADESWSGIAIPPFDGKDPRFAEYAAWHRQLAGNWAKHLADAIRAEDASHLITVGALDPVPMADAVDFYCYHLYPQAAKPGEDPLDINEQQWRRCMASLPTDKPLVIEEFYPMWIPDDVAAADVLAAMLRATQSRCAGWISFYWGRPERMTWKLPNLNRQYEVWLEAWSAGGADALFNGPAERQ